MSLEIRYQGDKIEAVLKLKNTDDTYKDLDYISEFYAYLYTSIDNIQKFSKTGGIGTAMTKVSSTEYLCTIAGTDSIEMSPGFVIMEILDADLNRQSCGVVYKLLHNRQISENI